VDGVRRQLVTRRGGRRNYQDTCEELCAANRFRLISPGVKGGGLILRPRNQNRFPERGKVVPGKKKGNCVLETDPEKEDESARTMLTVD